MSTIDCGKHIDQLRPESGQANWTLLHSSSWAQSAHYLVILGEADGVWRSNLREAIENCSTDFDFGNLTVTATRADTLTKQLEAMHFGFDETAAMITAPLLPDGAVKPFDCAKRFIAGLHSWAILLPRSTVAADRDDRISTACRDRGMALLGVVCAASTNPADLRVLWNLRQQFGPCWRIANRVCSDFDSPDIQRFRVDPDMHLAPLAAV